MIPISPHTARVVASGVGLLALAMLGCATFMRGEGIDPETVPSAYRQDYELFARRCSRCHSLSVPLTAHVDNVAHWQRYVERMRHQPNSCITAEDVPGLLRFLGWYTTSRQESPPAPAAPAAPAPAPAPADGGTP